MMRAGTGFSDKLSPHAAATEAVAAARCRLDGVAAPSAAMVFATAAWGPAISDLVAALNHDLAGCPMLGSTVAGLFTAGRGTAENPGVAVCLFEGLDIEGVCFEDLNLCDPESGREILDHLSVTPGTQSPLLLLADLGPQSPAPLLEALAAMAPDALIAGLGASPVARGKSVVWYDTEVFYGGLVAAVLTGATKTQWGVASTCRTASGSFRVSRARDRWISTLDGKPALSLLEDVARAAHLPASTESLRQVLVEVVHARTGNGAEGAPLRDVSALLNVVGIDPRRDAILLPEHVDVGATIRFAVRDVVAARENLEALASEQLHPDVPFALHLAGTSLDRAGETGAARDARCFDARAPAVPVLGLRGAQLLGPTSSRGRGCAVMTDASLLVRFEN